MWRWSGAIDPLIGEDETNSDGQYVIPKPAGIKGKFYSEVSKRRTSRYPHAHRCRAATSDIIKAP